MPNRQGTIQCVDGPYTIGWVRQVCGSCAAEWCEHKRRERCKECGADLAPPTELRFGGVTIEYVARRNKFILTDSHRQERCVEIADADVPDTLRFMLSLWRPWSEHISCTNAASEEAGTPDPSGEEKDLCG